MSRLALLLALLLAACAGPTRGPGTNALSFAEMQSINPGVDVNWLLSEYPFARDISRRPDGSVAQMGYIVSDPRENSRAVLLIFDENGILREKRYGGPIIRPPTEEERTFQAPSDP